MVHYCCVLNCKNNSRNNSKMGFHNVPKDPERQSVWLQAIGRNESILSKRSRSSKIDRRVCADHFSPRMFRGVRLKRTARPDLFKENEGLLGIIVGASTSVFSPEPVRALDDKRENTPPNEQGPDFHNRIDVQNRSDAFVKEEPQWDNYDSNQEIPANMAIMVNSEDRIIIKLEPVDHIESEDITDEDVRSIRFEHIELGFPVKEEMEDMPVIIKQEYDL